MPIPQQVIDTIRDRSDIVDVVSHYVDLKRVGGNFQGLCPFHDEKTPSFNVNPERQIFHCFGCGKGGNVFTFIMEMDGVSFPEAVQALGEKVGVEVPRYEASPEERSRNEALFAANRFAARFYHRQLTRGRPGEAARRTLEARGIPPEAWQRFGLGFAADAWDRLYGAARREGLRDEVLVQLRLVVAREKSTGYFDYFRNRIIFPIIAPGGRVVAFGARAMGDAEPKYLNSAESPIFSKRRTFYGVDRAADAIRRERRAVVVEGYTDLISLHLAGLEHTVATCGTALTPDHAIALRRLTQRAVLVPDGDAAGENAAVVSGALLLGAGLDVAVARLGEGEDPDTAARAQGSERMRGIVGAAMDYFVFLDYIVKERGMSPREQEGLIRRIVGGLSHAGDRLRVDVLVNRLAEVLGVEASSLRSGVRGGRRGSGEAPQNREGGRPDTARAGVEKLALRLVMEGTPLALEALDSLDAEDFSDTANRRFYNLLDSARDAHIDLGSREFQGRAEESDLAGLAAEIVLIPLPPGNVEVLLRDTIRKIKELKIRDELSVLRTRLDELPSDSEEAVAVAEYYHKLKQALVEL